MEADVGFSKRGSSEAWPSAAWYVRGMGRCANLACSLGKRCLLWWFGEKAAASSLNLSMLV